MRRRPPWVVHGRAILGVIALYALFLQAFLAHARPVPVLDAAAGVLCVEHGQGSAPADAPAHPCGQPCCTVAQLGTLLPPVSGAVTAWPRLAATRVVWRPEAAALSTGPPVRSSSPRGPPTA